MTEFKKWIERRERCEAFQFLDPNDAEAAAHFLVWNVGEYTLDRKKDGSFSLAVATPDGVVTVNQGDYLVRYGDDATTVVPTREFQRAWELEK